MRHIKFIIKASEKRLILYTKMMLIYTKNFGSYIIFRNTIMIIKTCLGSPANMEGGIYMSLTPFHNLCYLIPIGYILKGHLLHWGTGNDKSIIVLMTYLSKGAIKLCEIILGCMSWGIGFCINKIHLDLQRCITQKPQELGFCYLLHWHQIQN